MTDITDGKDGETTERDIHSGYTQALKPKKAIKNPTTKKYKTKFPNAWNLSAQDYPDAYLRFHQNPPSQYIPLYQMKPDPAQSFNWGKKKKKREHMCFGDSLGFNVLFPSRNWPSNLSKEKS